MNQFRSSDAYMQQWNKPPLLQIIYYHLFGKNLYQNLLIYCKLDTGFSETLIKIGWFSFTKMHVQISSANVGYFVQTSLHYYSIPVFASYSISAGPLHVLALMYHTQLQHVCCLTMMGKLVPPYIIAEVITSKLVHYDDFVCAASWHIWSSVTRLNNLFNVTEKET